MNKILKFNWNDRNSIYFSSDWHNFHDPQHWTVPIWEQRGYDSAAHAAQQVAHKINERVGKNDTLFFIGDGFLNATEEQVELWFDSINCDNIFYLYGNHESIPYRLYKKEIFKTFFRDDIEVYPLKIENVTYLGNYQEIEIGKQRIVLSHFPLHVFNKGHHGAWAISGHSHMTDKTRCPDYPYGKVLDVGWDKRNDVWSFDEIFEVMKNKSVKIHDHHDQYTT